MNELFESIKEGLKEAVEFSQGKLPDAKVTKIDKNDIKDVRLNMGMTQEEFAVSFGISLGTLRHWERGDRIPKGPAAVLLYLVKKDPKTILKLISQ